MVYGSSITNRVVIGKPVMARSVNGPQFTLIDGVQSCRCVYLSSGASLSGFTLTNGVSKANDGTYNYVERGGGVYCESLDEVLSNCVVVGSLPAGGVANGTLNKCSLSANSGGG